LTAVCRNRSKTWVIVRWLPDLDRSTLTVAQTVQRVGGHLVGDKTTLEASAAAVPLPKITRRELLAHRDQQDMERSEVEETWHEHGLVFPTGVGTPCVYAHTNLDAMREALDKIERELQ
jgi:hypothetical protein